MLTKEQINEMRQEYMERDYVTYNNMVELFNQAVLAISLQAENKRLTAERDDYADCFCKQNENLAKRIVEITALKGKLDKIRKLLAPYDVVDKMASAVMSIILASELTPADVLDMLTEAH
jgi:acetolactate synthase small subunit